MVLPSLQLLLLPVLLPLSARAQVPHLVAASVPEDPLTCPADALWPGVDWLVRAERPPAQAVAALEAYLFPPDLDWADKERRGVRTDGVVIVQGGEVVYERYANGYDAGTRHLAWSATKTFTAALAGVAVLEGRLQVEDSVCDHLAELPDTACAITVADLLSFSSGLQWKETYEDEPPTVSSVVAMLYGEGVGDMARFVLGHPLRDPPGTTYQYSSGDSVALAAVVGAALSPVHGDRFPWAVLLDPIGTSSVAWERDLAGTYVGSSYLYATPRDMARFGLLLLHDGCWAGERLLPAGWVGWTTELSEGLRHKAYEWAPGDNVQGRHAWINRAVPEQGMEQRPWPSAPEDTFMARGHWRQSIAVIPSLDLVIVRVADDRDGSFDDDRFLALALALVGASPEESP